MLREHHIPVSRTARYFTLGEMQGELTELWFVAHGYGQLAARFLRHFEVIAAPERLIVAPEALARFYIEEPGLAHRDARVGATWMTREDRLSEIDDYIRYLDALYAQILDGRARAAVRVTVLGFSQGVATVCRWLARGTSTADSVILWGGHLPHDMDLAPSNPLRAHKLLFVVGDQDHFATAEEIATEERRLRDHGFSFERRTFPGGHRLDYDTLRVLATSDRGEHEAHRAEANLQTADDADRRG
jgi:predicted esterase